MFSVKRARSKHFKAYKNDIKLMLKHKTDKTAEISSFCRKFYPPRILSADVLSDKDSLIMFFFLRPKSCFWILFDISWKTKSNQTRERSIQYLVQKLLFWIQGLYNWHLGRKRCQHSAACFMAWDKNDMIIWRCH